MSVSLERLETLRDERLANLDRYRERRKAHEKVLKRLRSIRAVMLTLLILVFIMNLLLLNIPALMMILGSTTVFYLTWNTLIAMRTETVKNLRTVEAEALDDAVQRIAYVEDRKTLALMDPDEFERLEAQAAKLEYEQTEEYKAQIKSKALKAEQRRQEQEFKVWQTHANYLSKQFFKAHDIADQVTLMAEIEEHNTRRPAQSKGLVGLVTRKDVQYWPQT